MPDPEHDQLVGLLRKVEEVRGLSAAAGPSRTLTHDDPDTLVRTLGELVDELERAHRRLIETNVQLVSLREVASRLAETVDIGETTRTVTRYLRRAFGFDQVGLLIIDREQGLLTGRVDRRARRRRADRGARRPARWRAGGGGSRRVDGPHAEMVLSWMYAMETMIILQIMCLWNQIYRKVIG